MSILLRFISLLSIPVTLVLFYGLIRSVGREQPYRKPLYLKGILMACLMMFVNMLFMVQAVFAWCPAIWPVFLLAGAGFGYMWAQSSKLYAKANRLFVKRSVLHLVFWAAAYAFTHLLMTVFPANIAAAGLAAMFFSTGSSIGMNANLVIRQRESAPIPRRIPTAPGRIGIDTCPRCGRPVEPGHAFCMSCGSRLR